MQMLYVDPWRCVGCRSCEVACAVEHSSGKSLASALLERVKPRIRVIPVAMLPLPVLCMHCDSPPCVVVCPTGALKRAGDAVEYDRELCIGCRSCMMVCPFAAVSAGEDGVVKCDRCPSRLEEGLPPACVEACPTGALRFRAEEEAAREAALRVAGGLALGLGVMVEPPAEVRGPALLLMLARGAAEEPEFRPAALERFRGVLEMFSGIVASVAERGCGIPFTSASARRRRELGLAEEVDFGGEEVKRLLDATGLLRRVGE